MPLNKLENFIKNTEGRILYVNPNDLDATDGIENQGNSLTKPFKTIQRALIESARFSYLRGNDNDITEKTTILLFPGEHLVDNRPGYAIKDNGGVATAVSPTGAESFAGAELTLTLNSNFDLTQSDNILYKFNSIYGGAVVPRGTSIVGLDLRKTKIRPKYVPNPTDSNAPTSAIFRITGACYFWQFSIFDGNELGLVYTDPSDFSANNQSRPTFSHHKLTCFEYADGVNLPSGYAITDLDMYYSKVGNAFNRASGREIDQKYPSEPNSFAKQRPEWEIVGAFAADPITISSIISGDGATPGTVVTVTTQTPHGLTGGTPIKIRGINVNDYNISTKVSSVISSTTFTYSLSNVRANLPAGPAAGLAPGPTAAVIIETDTVSGASPYVFNVSLRSVWGMNGMHADGAKASGFRSMVVAQFTAVSLQKDDRAFVKYNPSNRTYDSIGITKVTGEALSSESSSINQAFVYHLDPDAIYRQGWEISHIKMSNDAFIQIVSVFAIGFTYHFDTRSGGDASITNSNSNFGQVSLLADGFKAEAFTKDNKGYITSIVSPRAIVKDESQIEWVQFDVSKTKSVGISNHLYLLGYNKLDIAPPIISQGYRIGARVNDAVYVSTYKANILMTNGPIVSPATTISGSDSSAKVYKTTLSNTSNGTVYTIPTGHSLRNGESIRIFSETGDLPEGIEENTLYYAVTSEKKTTLGATEIQIASSRTNASSQTPLTITAYGGQQLRIESRVSDKESGELGHPIQWDPNQNQWFVHVSANSELYTYINGLTIPETDISYVLRKEDDRSLDEKIYKLRYVIPKELSNGRAPSEGFVIQESSSTSVRENSDFSLTSLTRSDYDYDRNPRFISTCTFNSGTATVTVRADSTHDLRVGDKIIVTNAQSTTNTSGTKNIGYNGTFAVSAITDDKTFSYSSTDIFGVTHNPGTFTSNTNTRTKDLPRFTRSDVIDNFYVYRSEVVTPYIYNVQDGVYYLYVLNSGTAIPVEFTDFKCSQRVSDLYPQQDRDNHEDNPPAAKSFTKRHPKGDVSTNDLKRSITRETLDKFVDTFSHGRKITGVSDSGTAATLTFDGEHQLGGIKAYTTLNGGSGHTNGTYYNVRLFNSNAAPSSAVWDGATANVTVSGGAVTAATLVEAGSGYTDGEQLYFDSSVIGGTPQANVVINSVGISTAVDNYVQVTGIGTTAGGYFRITSASNKSAISIAKTAGDPLIVANQYALNIGPAITIRQTEYDSTIGIATYQSLSSPHGLLAGNALRILDSSNNNLGDYIVNNVNSVNEFTVKTPISLADARWSLKHGMSANSASADNLGENLGVRSLAIYDNELLILGETITSDEEFIVDLPGAGIGTAARFPLGSYIQIDNEIMRVKSNTLTGAGSNELQVIRGSMGTIIESHNSGALIKKIRLTPIEFRRPSIVRASGHTFEYLGYGPGNYSTGLPQVQVKTLSEKEDFLAQAQETSCGSVLYTGMNSDGDFYIGNTKYSAQSGEQTTFDVPTPTITGEDPNRLSVVFDEVIVKERILVEGGNSGQILSQFDGPVTFNGDVRMNQQLILNDNLRVSGHIEVKNDTESTSCTTGALTVAGGVGISKRLNVCGDVKFNSTTESTSITTGSLVVSGGVGIGSTLSVGADIFVKTDRKIILGDSQQLQIYTDNTNSYITESSSGALQINTSALQIKNAAGSETLLTATENDAVALYYDNVSRLQTSSSGITVSGDASISGSISGSSLSISGSATVGPLTVNGSIQATGDISAFVSDDRLKTDRVIIANALEKVCSLNGFTYRFNDLAGQFGLNTEETHVGVSAQEVYEVLPEVTGPAPINSEYITVKYDKLVPLLIEAIKELKKEIEELKSSK
jgi:cytoskeletal protein CcmA (bactofilin family)